MKNNNTNQRLENLTNAQRALLLKKLKNKQALTTDHSIPQLARDNDGFPLSPAQKRMWFFQTMNPDSTTYNMASALRLTGKLDTQAFADCLQLLVERHEALHTTFSHKLGNPEQIVHKHAAAHLTQSDLTHLGAEQLADSITDEIRQFTTEPFDLTTGPLFKARLLKTADQQFIFLVTMHHIISDGWSMAVLIRELSALYQAAINHQSSSLPPLQCQYIDYVDWQQKLLTPEKIAEQLLYWKQQYADGPEVINLPTDYPRPAVRSFNGSSKNFTITSELRQQIEDYARQHSVTPYMLMLAVFNILLYKLTGDDDLVIGTPTANRNHPSLESVIGFFANTLAIRSKLNQQDTFVDFLRQIKATLLQAQKNQDVPFNQVVDEVNPKRSAAFNPLFQVMFVLQNVQNSTLNLADLQIENIALEKSGTDFDFVMELIPQQGCYHGVISYNTDLFRSASIVQMGNLFIQALQDCMSNPTQPYLNALSNQISEVLPPVPKLQRPSQNADLVQLLINSEARVRITPEQEYGFPLIMQIVREWAQVLKRITKPGAPLAVYSNKPLNLLIIAMAAWSEQRSVMFLPRDEEAQIQQLLATDCQYVISDQPLNFYMEKIQHISFQHLTESVSDVDHLAEFSLYPAIQFYSVCQSHELNSQHILAAIHDALHDGHAEITLAYLNPDGQFIIHALAACITASRVTLLTVEQNTTTANFTSSSLLITDHWNPELFKLFEHRKAIVSNFIPDQMQMDACRTISTEINCHLYNDESMLTQLTAQLCHGLDQRSFLQLQNMSSELVVTDLHQLPPVPGSLIRLMQRQGSSQLTDYGIVGKFYSPDCISISMADDWCWYQGQRISLSSLAAVIQSHDLVVQAAFCFSQSGLNHDHTQQLACFLMVNPTAPWQKIITDCKLMVTADAWHIVEYLPYQKNGELDRALLTRLPILSEHSKKTIEASIQKQTAANQVAVVIQHETPKRQLLHYSDLMTDWKSSQQPSQHQTSSLVATPPLDQSSVLSQPSLLTTVVAEVKKPAELICLLEKAAQSTQQIHFVHSTTESEILSYADLLADARMSAQVLHDAGIRAGDNVLLLLEHNTDIVRMFWAAVVLGAIPVIQAPPQSFHSDSSDSARFLSICQTLQPSIIILAPSQQHAAASFLKQNGVPTPLLLTLAQLQHSTALYHRAALAPDTTALLLLTSGSTGMPKAVIQTHQAVIQQIYAHCEFIEADEQHVSVNWMPLDHVGGLIMSHLKDVYLCCKQVHVKTQTILESPPLWLDLIHQHRATWSWAPNFAYALINNLSDQLTDKHWDLSCVRCLLTGGEAIQTQTNRDFLQNLAKFKLSEHVIVNAWGMSETCSTCIMQRFDLHRVNPKAEVGLPIQGLSLRIVDNQNMLVRAGEEGQLQVCGPVITQGYFNNPVATADAFTADGWFRTGDRARLNHGQLVITGRDKDIVIINGLNYQASDIEKIVDSCGYSKISYTAACGIKPSAYETEQLVVFFVPDSQDNSSFELQNVTETIKQKIISELQINPAYIIPVQESDIPKSSIGKLLYTQLRVQFQNGQFDHQIKVQDLQNNARNHLSNWFSQPVWQRQRLQQAACRQQKVLIIADAEQHCRLLTTHSTTAFYTAVLHEGQIRFNGHYYPSYQALFAALQAQQLQITGVTRLLNVQGPKDSQSLIQCQDLLIGDLLDLCQGLQEWQPASVSVFVMLLPAPVLTATTAVYTMLRGIVRTLPAELNGIKACLIHLADTSKETLTQACFEIAGTATHPEVKYNRGKRMVSQLSSVMMPLTKRAQWAIQPEGWYLMTGGSGGIGLFTARKLLSQTSCKLLLTGSHMPDPDSAKGQALQRLLTDFGADRVQYQAVSLLDASELGMLVKTTEQQWQTPLAGIFHLAGKGNLQEHLELSGKRLLATEDVASYATMLTPKVTGTYNLLALLQDLPQALFVAFSSVSSILGSRSFAAYATANAFLDDYCLAQHANSYVINWSMWADTGMTAGVHAENTSALGYETISPEDGWQSLRAVLHQPPGRYVVGLDITHARLTKELGSVETPAQSIVCYLSSPQVPAPLPVIKIKNLFQHDLQLSYCEIDQFPLLDDGSVDLPRLSQSRQQQAGVHASQYKMSAQEQLLLAIWQDLLGKQNIRVDDNFFSIGGDSILSAQVIARVRQHDYLLTTKHMFEHQTIASLALVMTPISMRRAEQSPITGACPRLPIQQWFFSQQFSHPEHWNQSLLLKINSEDIQVEALQVALNTLAEQHDALRLRFDTVDTGDAYFAAPEPVNFICHDLRQQQPDTARLTMEQLNNDLQSTLSLSTGSLLKAALYLLPQQQYRLLLVVHHLITDGVSWRILVEDLHNFYQQKVAGQQPVRPAKSSSYQEWATHIVQQAKRGDYEAQLDYWTNTVASATALPLLPGNNRRDTERQYEVQLDQERTTALLTATQHRLNVSINDLLLTAFSLAVNQWKGDGDLTLNLEGHGRDTEDENLDVSRTVGWFTSMYPVLLQTSTKASAVQNLATVKQQLKAIPAKGAGYGILRYLCGHRTLHNPNIALSFNYLGQLDQSLASDDKLFAIAIEHPGQMYHSQEKRPHVLDAVCYVLQGELKICLTYAQDCIETTTIQSIAQHFLARLIELITVSQNITTPVWVAADFPLLKNAGQQLPQLLTELATKEQLGNIDNIHPITGIQHGILYHSVIDPEGGAYVSQLINELTGPLIAEHVKKAWQTVLNRHEIYRTSFYYLTSNAPTAVVHKEVKLDWRFVDHSQLSSQQQVMAYEALLQQDRLEGFQLEQAPLMRVYLVRLAANCHRMILSEHHAISDGWSRTLILQEVLTAYQAFNQGQQPRLSAAPQFSKYITWLQQQDQQQALQYWRQYLTGITGGTRLTIEKTAVAGQTFKPATHQCEFSTQLTAELKALAARESATVNLILQAAWAILLHRYSGEQDIVFGATVSGRTTSMLESEKVVGPFLNSLPVRTSIEKTTSARRLIGVLHKAQVERSSFEYVALSDIVTVAQLPAGQALFQSLLVFENYPSAQAEDGPLQVSWTDAKDQTNLPITLMITPGQQLHICVYYDSSLYTVETIEQVLQHLQVLLQSMCRLIDQPVTNLQLISDQQYRTVFDVWNPPTECFGTEHLCLQQLLTAQAERTPDSIAIIDDAGQLNYRQVYNESVQLSRQLLAGGARPNQLIAVILEKGWQQVVATYSIMYAGAAYLPIDPKWPQDRIRYLLEYSEVQQIIATTRTAKQFEDIPHYLWHLLPERVTTDTTTLTAPPPTLQQVSDLAYVIFTSGSTGKPKGVMIDHRGAVNTVVDINRRFNVQPNDRVLALSSLSFDLSVYDFFGLLATGGAVIIPNEQQATDPAAWSALIQQHQATIWNTVPALMQLLVEHREKSSAAPASQLRLCMMSGDWIPLSLPDRIKHCFPQCQIMSLGGATEASIWSIAFPIEHIAADWNSIPYGKALANQKFFVFDQYFNPCPVGVRGDLYIGGIGLAKGYWRDQEKTAASFMQHPVTAEPLYRTGDLGYYREDGNIIFAGRSDFQVKVNGYRIELGEVQSALNQHPEIRDSIIVVREDVPGEKRLAAYLIPQQVGGAPDKQLLRKFLSQSLPEYMIPWIFIVMSDFPLSPNGKVDLKQLPAPALEEKNTGIGELTTTEEIILAIWLDVLGLADIGIHDNFFELGGHSLLSAQVIARLRETFSIDLPMRSIFNAPTVQTLAQEVNDTLKAGKRQMPALIKAATRGHELSQAQRRLWFLYQLEGKSATYNISSGLRIRGELDLTRLQQALTAVVGKHPLLSSKFQQHAGQVRIEHQPIAANVLQIITAPASQHAPLIKAETDYLFDLEKGPLYRFTLLQAADECILLLVIHHIIADGWSMGLFMQDLASYYQQLSEQKQIDISTAAWDYQDYVQWEGQLAATGNTELDMAYWRKQLATLNSLINLPTDKPRPEVQSYRGATHFFCLSSAQLNQLELCCRKHGVTLNMLLITSLSMMLHIESGDTDIAVGSTVANRPLAEFESLFGLFANQVVIRSAFSSNLSLTDLIKQVKHNTIDAFQHQMLPFEKVVETVAPERTLAHTPLFQVKLVLQNMPFNSVDKTGLYITPLELEPGTSKFDLQFTMQKVSEGLHGMLTYNTDIYESKTTLRLIDQWQKVIQLMTDSPDLSVSAVKNQLIILNMTSTPVDVPSLQPTLTRRQRKPELKDI